MIARFLKYGEREGAEDGNKVIVSRSLLHLDDAPRAHIQRLLADTELTQDRVKISTNARGTATNMVDYCQGLGSFAQIGKDATTNVGIQHDGAVAADAGKNYEIYVRSAFIVPYVKHCNDLKGASFSRADGCKRVYDTAPAFLDRQEKWLLSVDRVFKD